MSGDYSIETRRRSRSKTPFLRSSCDHENCEHLGGDEPHTHHHKKKPTSQTPNVITIVEEAVEVTSSSSVGNGGKDSPSKMTQTKIKTSDYSSEDSPETKIKPTARYTLAANTIQSQQKQSESKASTTTTTTTTTVVTKTKKNSGNVATSTPKGMNNLTETYAAQFLSRGGGEKRSQQQQRTKEYTQNVLNTHQEINSSASHKNKNSLSGFFGSPFGAGDKSLNSDTSDHIAYMEYKKAGEYWKTTPKTDYTYSELSPHRRELAPGVVAMPNMSRRSIENHFERINYMIERDPSQEEYIRRRYEASRYTQNRLATERLAYESGDEVDQTYHRRNASHLYATAAHHHEESWLVRLITTIVTSVSTVWTTVIGGGTTNQAQSAAYSYNSSMYQTKIAEERGFFGSIWHGISSGVLAVFRNLYLFISSVLCWDTWILQSSSAENKNKKRFLLLLLILLPLLLLAGIYYYLHPNEPFPPKSFTEYTFTLPELPKITISEYINEEKYNQFKSQAYNRFDDFRDWSNDYFMYLKTVTQNILDEGRKKFQGEQYYERI